MALLIPTKKIPQLTAYGVPLAGAEMLEISVTGTSRRITARDFVLPIDSVLTSAGMGATLPGSRQLTAGIGIALVDGGSGSTLQINATGAVAGPANPTALAGINPVNGVLLTYMRSDAAPALDPVAVSTLSPRYNILRFGAVPDGVTDNTTAIQNAIEALPNTGGSIFVPEGDFAVTGLRLDGLAANKSNVRLYGVGNSSIIRQLGTASATGVPGGDTTQSPNVIAAYFNSGFEVENIRVIGNKDSGGIKPIQAASWVGSTLYTVTGTPLYRQTRADGTAIGAGAELPTDLVWLLLITHVSDPVDIDVDVALGRWSLVTNFAALNGYYYDESFNRGMCIYFGGPNAGVEVTNIRIENCRIEKAYFANVLCGSGPEKTGLVGAGLRNGRVSGCSIDDSSAGAGGLLRHDFEISGNTITGVTGNGINCDRDGSNQTISGNVIKGHDTLAGRNGISSYRSDHIVVTGNYVANFGNAGINFQDLSSAADLAGSITGNTVVDCGQVATDTNEGNTGIVVSSSDHVAVTGNHIRNPFFNGIKVDDSNGVAVTGNTVYAAGAFGINFEDCFGFTCSGNNVRESQRDNFYFEGCRQSTVSGNSGIDGNTLDSATLYSGFRIGPFGATESTGVVFSGNKAFDSRTPKQQHYGLNIEAASTGITSIANDFTGNKDANFVNAGTANPIGFNRTSGSASWRTTSTVTPETDIVPDVGASALRFNNVFGNQLRPGAGTVIWTSGAGTPELALTAPIGSLFTRTDGATGTILYLKETGAGNTGWVAAPSTPALNIWTVQQSFTSSGAGDANAAVKINANAPFIRWREADQAADSRDWLLGASAGIMQLGAVSDAGTSIPNGGLSFQATRTGATVTAISLGNNTANPTFTLVGTGLLTVGGAASITGEAVFLNSNTVAGSYGVELFSSEPAILFNESGTAANNGQWDIGASGETLRFRTINDAYNTAVNWLVVDRTGTVIDFVTFPNGVVRVTTASSPNVAGSNAVNFGTQNNGGSIAWANTTAAADTKYWDMYTDTTFQAWRTLTDALGTPVEWMRITRSGTAISSVAFPTTTAGAFVVGGTAVTPPAAQMAQFIGTASNTALYAGSPTVGVTAVNVHNAATAGDNIFAQFGTEAAFTTRGSITYNRAGGLTVYNTTSDARLKKNIADSPEASDIIDSIRVRSFDWIESGNHLDYWLVAQELYGVFPLAVSVGKEGRDWAVDPSKLVPLLVKELQSVRNRLLALEQ